MSVMMQSSSSQSGFVGVSSRTFQTRASAAATAAYHTADNDLQV